VVLISTSETVGTVVNVAALLFVGAQVLLARQAIKESTKAQQREWDRLRKQATIEATITTAQYREALRASLPWNDRDPKAVAAFLTKIGDDRSKLMPISEYFNHLTDLAVGVKQGVFDLETLSMLEGGRIIDTAASFAPYFERARRETGRPSVYEDIDELVDMLKVQRAGKL
jgi:hypothetical protein